LAPVSVPAFAKSQGTYLKGHGVAYTILLPPPKQEPKASPPPAPSPSEWDRVRKQIRGERSSSSGSSPKPKEPSVEDIVLEVLAKNGHHFSQLADNESLTVSIIFRPEERPRRGRLSASEPIPTYDTNTIYDINAIYAADALSSSGWNFDVEDSSQPVDPAPQTGGKGSSESGQKKKSGGESGGGSAPAADQGSSDYELLGDLRLKQGQGFEALQAYQQALAKSSDVQHAATMYLKMAQLYLTVQKDEAEARHAIERAKELLAQAANPAPSADKSAPKTDPPASPLPSRLIITAPKRLLDQVGAGKKSVEEFKKAATVERLTFSASGK
jgi:tetratricopeptide (TPR) repeat protein